MRDTTKLSQRTGHLFKSLPLAVIVFLLMATMAIADDAKLWTAIKNGEAFAIMRHALAPGTGDPQNFSVTDCTTQRNLSTEGRDQARMIGRRFRRQGITSAEVYSSEWCRCQDTAELLYLGTVKPLPSLNSFFETYERRELQIRAIKKWLIAKKSSKPLVLVSHQVNIFALTGTPTSSGETVVAQINAAGQVKVLGTLE
ncbi:MAG: histidine phosphatase family protein [Hyphomicrobiaceae bacterium]